MKKVVFWEAVLERFHAILKKNSYCNTDMLSIKWTQMNRSCTRFNGIYNKSYSEKQSGANDFDLL